MLPRLSSRESGLGAVAGQGEQLVGDGRVALGPEVVQLALQSAHLGPQDGVLLGYSELRGCDDVTEQGLGHDCSGLSSEEGEPGAPGSGRRELWQPQGDRPGHAGQRETYLLPVSRECRVRHAVVKPVLPCTAASWQSTRETEPGARAPSSAATTEDTASSSPSSTTSTRPSGRLLAEPLSPAAPASPRTNHR